MNTRADKPHEGRMPDGMLRLILRELKRHAPFTFLGAVAGIVIMLALRGLPYGVSYKIFYVLHPLHVLLSALVTAAMFKLHTCKKIGAECIKGRCNLWALIAVGYAGSIGIATLSDSVIPYIGEALLNMPDRHAHIGFIEKWWIVNPLALIGIVIAYFKPATRFPHAGHVLVSTGASLFHIMMAMGRSPDMITYIAITLFLFVSVWVPCCVSDIVFPLLFVREDKNRITE